MFDFNTVTSFPRKVKLSPYVHNSTMLSSSNIERLIAEKRREIEREKIVLGLSPPPLEHVSRVVVYKTIPPVAAFLVPHSRDIDFLLCSAQLISYSVLILYSVQTLDSSSVKISSYSYNNSNYLCFFSLCMMWSFILVNCMIIFWNRRIAVIRKTKGLCLHIVHLKSLLFFTYYIFFADLWIFFFDNLCACK